jgi:ornithine cyclodeaminase/alanine dehydrogenase
MKTRVLTQSDVRDLLDMEQAVEAVERAFAAHGRGETLMPVKVYLELPQFHGDFRAMPAYLEGSAGVKWVNSHPENPSRHGLPSVLGMYILSDPETAVPLAVMDATWLTAVRTGAAAGVATRYLGPRQVDRVGFVGTGVQARTLYSALRVVCGEFEVVASDRDPEAAVRFSSEVGGRTGSVEEASSCDVVCTATPSHRPVVRREWVRSGALVNAMGADAHGKQELDPRLLRDGKIVVDDWEQACASGEVNVPLASGDLTSREIHAALGEIVAGEKSGREGDEITVFDSTGLAVQDVALARLVFDRAKERDAGSEVDFFA